MYYCFIKRKRKNEIHEIRDLKVPVSVTIDSMDTHIPDLCYERVLVTIVSILITVRLNQSSPLRQCYVTKILVLPVQKATRVCVDRIFKRLAGRTSRVSEKAFTGTYSDRIKSCTPLVYHFTVHSEGATESFSKLSGSIFGLGGVSRKYQDHR